MSANELDQLSLVGEVERSGGDQAAIRTLTERHLVELSEDEIDDINATSSDASTEWVGLPQFLPVNAPLKVVISCSTRQDRDALLGVLGIRTVHKGTRGTLSVWWPDREKEDLSSLRFTVGEEPEP